MVYVALISKLQEVDSSELRRKEMTEEESHRDENRTPSRPDRILKQD